MAAPVRRRGEAESNRRMAVDHALPWKPLDARRILRLINPSATERRRPLAIMLVASDTVGFDPHGASLRPEGRSNNKGIPKTLYNSNIFVALMQRESIVVVA